MIKKAKKPIFLISFIGVVLLAIIITTGIYKAINENKILKQVVKRLEADSRIAQVLVTDVRYDENQKRIFTTIKLLEYDTEGNPLDSKYFTFPGNVIQFQSLVVRFDDVYVKKKDLLKGRSVYLFWKVFMLDGKNTVEYEITDVDKIPQGYKLEDTKSRFERKIWKRFWEFALDPEQGKSIGIKNAQIEAPGTMFVPGTLYTIKIEHDGGIRIDAQDLPDILKGEFIPEDPEN
jgi:hypothetical protein